MPPSHDPMRHFGRKIQAAVSRDPAFDAMFERGRQIPNTWGNLASQLMEEGLIEPTPEAAMDLLGIDREQLGDTSLLFTEPYEVEVFEGAFTERHAESYKEARVPAAQKFIDYLSGELSEKWRVEDEPAEMDELEVKIDELMAGKDLTQEEYEVRMSELGKLTIKKAALSSGLAVPLAEFVRTVLSYEDEEAFTKADRASALGEIIRDLERKLIFTKRVKVDEILIGRQLVNSYVFGLDHRLTRRSYSYANQQWSRIEHLFIAPRPEEHPFFAGTEK